jgi:hypothetical protein
MGEALLSLQKPSGAKKSFRPAERDFFEQRTFKKVVD